MIVLESYCGVVLVDIAQSSCARSHAQQWPTQRDRILSDEFLWLIDSENQQLGHRFDPILLKGSIIPLNRSGTHFA